jgi:hypothetical protein
VNRTGRRIAVLGGVLWVVLASPIAAADAVLARSLTAGEAVAAFAVGALDRDLLAAGEADRPLTAACADRQAVARRQALAHALDCWFVEDGQGGWLFTRNPTLASTGCTSRIHPSALAQRPGLEAQVQAGLATYLAAPAGIAFNPIDSSWVASLTPAGHQALVRLLTALERPGAIPPLLAPAEPARSGPDLPATAWPEQVAALVDRWGISVSLAPEVPAQAPAITAGLAADLPRQLQAHGLAATWIHGVLCIGGPALDRLHPGHRAAWSVIPVPHLVRDPGDGQRLADAIIGAWPSAWATQPGWTVTAIDRTLFISADAAGIHAALALSLIHI